MVGAAHLGCSTLWRGMLGGGRPDLPWGKAPFAKASTEKEQAQREVMLTPSLVWAY